MTSLLMGLAASLLLLAVAAITWREGALRDAWVFLVVFLVFVALTLFNVMMD